MRPETRRKREELRAIQSAFTELRAASFHVLNHLPYEEFGEIMARIDLRESIELEKRGGLPPLFMKQR